MSEIISASREFGYATLVIDTTEENATTLQWYLEESASVNYQGYPDGVVPNNAIIYPQEFEQETIEKTYPAEEEGGEEETTTVNVAENYFEDMQMAWNFAYAVYENLRTHGVSEMLARQVLPSCMMQVRIEFTILLEDFEHLMEVLSESDEPKEFKDLVTKVLEAMESA